MHHFFVKTLGQARRLVVIVVGFTLLVTGTAMIVLPGPALLVIPVGLAVLASEFLWARKLLATVKQRIESWRNGKNHNRA